MKTTTVDKSKVKTLEDFKKLQWTNVSAKQKADVYCAIAKIQSSVVKIA
ncbi:hypothetical protein [Flavobacterium sp. N1994]|nr:hypothetical protein [Flavobacterium sp. N1994]